MSSALSLIVMGQVYLLVPASNFSLNQLNYTLDSSILRNLDPSLSGSLPGRVRDTGYTYTPGIGAHKFHTQSADWYTALQICCEEGGHLAVINSRTESDTVAKLFANAGPHLDTYDTEYAWVGFHDLYGGKGRYETVHGDYVENVGFNEWVGDNRGGFGKYSGAIHKIGKFAAFAYSNRLAFVCELPNIPINVNEHRDNLSTLNPA